MKSRDFIYWLQGFFELSGVDSITSAQLETIKNHLNLVFVHDIDPEAGGPKVHEKLNQIHGPRPPAKIPGQTLIRC